MFGFQNVARAGDDVDYAGGQADRAMIRDWIAAIEAVDPVTLTRDAAMAYWINLYNAATVQVILVHYPVSSILEIDLAPPADGPWAASSRPIEAIRRGGIVALGGPATW